MSEVFSSIPIAFWLGAILNFLFGYLAHKTLNFIRLGKVRDQGDKILTEAKERVGEMRANWLSESQRIEGERRRELDRLTSQELRRVRREEERGKALAQQLEVQRLDFERKKSLYEEMDEELKLRRQSLKQQGERAEEIRLELINKLETVSQKSRQAAERELMDLIGIQLQGEIDQLNFKLHAQATKDAEIASSKIIATTIDRMAISLTSHLSAFNIQLPNEEIKGRIIGRDGRNIKYLEHVCGVSFVLEENNSITISTFDHMRRHIAKMALERLIADGRIHRDRIDEAHEIARIEVSRQVQEAGQSAVSQANAGYFHPQIVELIGKMKFRTSVGQNLLEHSLEVSALLGLMAGELKLNVTLARRIGLLHDIGKVISHEVEGSHALVGRDLALKFGESAQVANGIACHHQECPAETIEGSLCKAADAISAGRAGARQGKVEDSVKRFQQLEAIALRNSGIDKAYVLQAGRELRIFVQPEKVTDQGALQLSRQLAKQIHGELQFPGKIQVTVIRESRYVEFAL